MKKIPAFSWYKDSFGGFLLKSHVPALGGLTAFRDFIHRLPRKCKFISSLGANFTLQSMETMSELLWFCKGRSLWRGSIAAEKGINPPRASHLEKGSESQTLSEGPCTHPPPWPWGIPISGLSLSLRGCLAWQGSARGQDRAREGTYQVGDAGEVLLGGHPPVVGGVSPDVAGCVLLREKTMGTEDGDHSGHRAGHPSWWKWGGPALPGLCWCWQLSWGRLPLLHHGAWMRSWPKWKPASYFN